MRKVGKELWTILEELCQPKAYMCWGAGGEDDAYQAANWADQEQKAIDHCLEAHRTRIARVNGYWWILD